MGIRSDNLTAKLLPKLFKVRKLYTQETKTTHKVIIGVKNAFGHWSATIEEIDTKMAYDKGYESIFVVVSLADDVQRKIK